MPQPAVRLRGITEPLTINTITEQIYHVASAGSTPAELLVQAKDVSNIADNYLQLIDGCVRRDDFTEVLSHRRRIVV